MRSPSSPSRHRRGRASSFAPVSPSAAVLSPDRRGFGGGDELRTPPSLTRTRLAASASAHRRRRLTSEAEEEENSGAAVASGEATAAAASSADDDDEECAICLEILVGGEVYVGECGHGFHRACLVLCRAANATKAGRCPLCRAAMPRGLTPAHAREACAKSFQQRRIAGRTGRARDAVRARMLEMQQQRRLDAAAEGTAAAAAATLARAAATTLPTVGEARASQRRG